MNIRLLLFPFSFLYGIVTFVRNKFYDLGIFKSVTFPFPVICIGNLSAGGTGKTPLTHYILNLLSSQKQIAVLSRGYGRKTKGFLLADENSTAQQIGDEPLTYFKSFRTNNKIKVAVCESRVEGITKLKQQKNNPEVIILDDAFQHRAVNAGLYILTTQYDKLYFDDNLLPSGSLREYKSGANRAQIIIVTKCPIDLSETQKQNIKTKLHVKSTQHLFFSSIDYADLIPLSHYLTSQLATHNSQLATGNSLLETLVVTGIAHPQSLVNYLQSKYKSVKHIAFNDHHDFAVGDIIKAKKIFDTIASENKIIITTEKDAMRLMKPELQYHLESLPVFVQQIKFQFNQKDKLQLDQLIQNYVKENTTNG